MFEIRRVSSLVAIPTSVPVYFTARCVKMRERKDKVCIFACMHLCTHRDFQHFLSSPRPDSSHQKGYYFTFYFFISTTSCHSSALLMPKLRLEEGKEGTISSPQSLCFRFSFLFYLFPYNACQHLPLRNHLLFLLLARYSSCNP